MVTQADITAPNKVIKSSTSTIQQGVAKADGKLWMTAETLHFAPYNEDLGPGTYNIPLTDIAKVEKDSLPPSLPEGFKITLLNDHTYHFIVANSETWIELIEKYRDALGANVTE
ncbi:hypothetical protein HCH_03048 [Hahella chejuensis KCTC 2396]|uniref:GRAM domain-containing protein n=1 Tax=Hahella chejuensis (strain KCTC 2396) TaxID=349521 RepID=Q2SHR0_HAHCH|nr:hypothetical protein [Hahella chejuensis]ABC29814.1 hypothetical protein HCH_03048 [Hahella chejuensis KCTC 2396]